MKTTLYSSKKKALAIKHAPVHHVFHGIKKRLKALENHRKLESARHLNIEVHTLAKYPLNEPYAYTRIVRDPFRGNLRYQVEEPHPCKPRASPSVLSERYGTNNWDAR